MNVDRAPTRQAAHGGQAVETDRARAGTDATADGTSADIAARYRSAVEGGDSDGLAALYRPDALLDAHVPHWRFQAKGREAVAPITWAMPRPGEFTSFEAEAITGGLLVRLAWAQDGAAGGTVSRQLHVWRLFEGRIAEQLIFCAGMWDRHLQERMAVEAPLVRP